MNTLKLNILCKYLLLTLGLFATTYSFAFQIGDKVIYLPSQESSSLTRIPGTITNLSPNILVKLDTGKIIEATTHQLGNPKNYFEVNFAESKQIELMLQNDLAHLPDFLYARLESPQIRPEPERLALPIGKLINMGGYRFNLICQGEEHKGIPTVILETGSGNPGISWVLVQREVAKFTRVCTYDRGGYGWSDLSPFSRDPKHITEELHTLLTQAKISKPMILAGHSIGGLIIRLYEKMYPEEVFGLVLVDSSEGHIPDTQPTPEEYLENLRTFDTRTRNNMKALLTQRDEMQLLTYAEHKLIYGYLLISAISLNNPKHVKTAFVDEDKEFYRPALKEVNAMISDTLKEKPLRVISTGSSRDVTMIKTHDEIAKQSNKGKHIPSLSPFHDIEWSDSSTIVKTIKEMINETTQ